ncbi:MAG TPA: hypothetical protein DD473_13635, partial [Planctomycetaceae bacterium]|nr:hypothetical protein [Planctomycetaceae bacterium]
MSNDHNSNPDWSLLPSQPQKFFDLEDDFSLRDLKRSYGKLIKKFRPEQSPDEFQKIRMAYERLLQIVHDNIDTIDITRFRSPEPERHSHSNHDDSHSAVPPSERSVTKIDVCANVQEGRPLIEIYQSLLAQNYMTEEDFLSLAVLSDVIDDTAEDENFAEWLIRGINYLHSAPLLNEYLLEYSRTHIPDGKLEEWITLLANRLPPNSFSFISTPAWMQLIRAESEGLNGTFSTGRFIKLWRKITTLHAISSEYSLIDLASRLLPALTVLERGEGYQEIEYFLDSNPQFFDQNLDFEREFVEVIKYFIVRTQKDFQYESQYDFAYKLIIDYCIYDDKLEIFSRHRNRLDHDLPAILNKSPTLYSKYHQLLNEVIPWILMDASQHLFHQNNSSPKLHDLGPEESEFQEVESTFWWKHVNRVLFISCMCGCMLLMGIIGISVLGPFQSRDANVWFLLGLFSVLLGLCVGYYVNFKQGELIRQKIILNHYQASWRMKFGSEALNHGLNWQDVEHLLNQPSSDNQSTSSVRSRFYRLLRVDPLIQLITTLFANWMK